MNILLVNDDGINAPGILKLEQLLKKYGDVYVVAPLVEQSGKGCAINAFRGIKIQNIDNRHIAVMGTPVDCVEIGLSLLPINFDLVVSGCNNGYNLSVDTMYSGTCGACFQGMLGNVKSIAFSTYNNNYMHLLDDLFDKIMDYVINNDLLSNEYYLNVNIPGVNNVDEIQGIKLTKIVFATYEKYHVEKIEDDTYIVGRNRLLNITDSDCDDIAIKNNYISITPMGQTTFHYGTYLDLVKKINK